MAVTIDLTLDCANPSRLAVFWKLALAYEDEPLPAPSATREEWLPQFELFDIDADDGAWLHDRAGAAPRLSLLQVPESKATNNRLHIDIRIAGQGNAGERWKRVTEAAE